MLLHGLRKVKFLQLEVSGVLWLIMAVSLTLPSFAIQLSRSYSG